MAFKTGTVSVTVSGVAKPLSATSIQVKQLLIQALPGNAGPLFVGDSTVLYSGVSGGGILIPTPVSTVPDRPIQLMPEGATAIADLKDIYINSASGLPGVNFFYDEY